MSKSARRRIVVQAGKLEITKLGVPRPTWQDAYHLILSLTWPQFFAGAVLAYLAINLAFATVYALGDHAVDNARSFADYFFFSVNTFAKVGYSNMNPNTLYGQTVATIQIIAGVLGMAVITSLIFARFSKPTARVLFSRAAIVTSYDGVPTLMLRVANQRRSLILEAQASLTLVRREETKDGHHLTRFHDLQLDRARTPLFALSWLIMHRIDEASPLHGLTAADFERGDLQLIVTLSGVDETFAASVNARHIYTHEDIVFERKFADVIREGADSRQLYFDLDRFHELEPAEHPLMASRN